jgi:tetratricopeptide (TPR) repeat protein
MPGGLVGALGQFFQQRFGTPQAPKPASTTTSTSASTQASPAAQSAPSAQGTSAQATTAQATMPEFQPSSVPAFQDPIVSNLHQELAQEQQQQQPVPTEAEQLKQEQHAAWGGYDFERCIVIFSRLHELEPNDPAWSEKLRTSYFNRGKQYEQEGNIQRATQCYYAALQLDPSFTEAQEAAQSLLQQQGAPTTV